MKRKDLLLVTFLLSQTMPVGAMDLLEDPQLIGVTLRPHASDETIRKALRVQNSIQDIVARTEEAGRHYPNAAGSVIVVGKTGSGKSTFITGTGSILKIEVDPDGELDFQTKNPLGTPIS